MMTQFRLSTRTLLLLAALLLISCEDGSGQTTAVPDAPDVLLATATAEDGQGDEAAQGFPTPADTEEPPAVDEPSDEGVEPTAVPTETIVLPTPTSAPVSNPPVRPLDLDNLPPINHDLAFVQAGSLMLWTHHNGQIAPLVTPTADLDRYPAGTFAEVALISFSADGNRAAVAIRYDLPPEELGDGSGDSESAGAVEEGPVEFDILYVDVVSKEVWPLVTSIKNQVTSLALSPDKAYLAFATVIDDGRNDDAEMGEFKELDGKLFRINTPAAVSPSPLEQVAECTGNCRELTWRQDSDLYFFSDQEGVYFANARSSQAQTLIANEVKNQFLPLTWSPNDRAVLMYKRQTGGPAAYVVYDLPTQTLIPLPEDVFESTVILPTTIWLADSRLMAAFSSTNGGSVQLATYRVDFNGGSIGIDERVDLPTLEMLGSLKQLVDGRYMFVSPHFEDPNAAGLYRLTSFSQTAERLNGLPLTGDTPDAIWSADGSAAVVLYRPSYLASADGGLYQFEQQIDHALLLPPSNAQR